MGSTLFSPFGIWLPRPPCIKVASSFHKMPHGTSRHEIHGRRASERNFTGFQANPAIGTFGRWIHDSQGFVDAQDVADALQGIRRELYVWQLLILGQRALGHTTEQLHHLFLGTVPFTTDIKEALESHMPFGFFVIEGHYDCPCLGWSRSSIKSSLTPSESKYSSQTGSVGRS